MCPICATVRGLSDPGLSHMTRSGGAGDLDQETPPARYVGAGNAERASGRVAAALHPGREPGLDLGRQVPDGVAIGQMDPDAGIVVEGWVWNQEEFVAFVNALEVAGALAKDETVDGGAETARVLRRERRWLSRMHGGPRIAAKKAAGRL